MLVLERKEWERIAIHGPDGVLITVALTKVTGPTKAKIGIEAPPEWKILRVELEDGNGK